MSSPMPIGAKIVVPIAIVVWLAGMAGFFWLMSPEPATDPYAEEIEAFADYVSQVSLANGEWPERVHLSEVYVGVDPNAPCEVFLTKVGQGGAADYTMRCYGEESYFGIPAGRPGVMMNQ